MIIRFGFVVPQSSFDGPRVQDRLLGRAERAVLGAYERGEIELEAVDPKAPRHTVYDVLPGGKTYSLDTVARFLGWIQPSDGRNGFNLQSRSKRQIEN